MKRTALTCVLVLVCAMAIGCNEDMVQKKVIVEEVQAYKPNLPSVPSIPKPTVAETHSDGTYSVYGLRKGLRKMIETQVTVTAYIAKIYEKPICPEGKTCHVLMPHLFLADERDEKLERRHLRMVGYAQSFKDMEDEKLADEEGREEEELPEGVYLPPIVYDWRLGHKYKITGRFTRQSGSGFMATDGLIEYSSHECLDCPVEEEEKKK
ncbi:MAG: hypothetical protein GY854_15535 [Deltaproteobacteria bacterium]|nr:hypothetical protein [Deltaproteobacteria bacterium]